MGNLLSVKRAFEHCGATVNITNLSSEIERAEKLVLPGVGAFEDGMYGLHEKGLVRVIKVCAERGVPLLGICLGMQMLMDESEEFGVHKGLGLIPGFVQAIPPVGVDGEPHNIPFVGWNELLRPTPDTVWSKTILDGIPEKSAAYFVHSFTVHPKEKQNRLADSDYDGQRISAVICHQNIYGCQFHPEKSGKLGLTIINNFVLA